MLLFDNILCIEKSYWTIRRELLLLLTVHFDIEVNCFGNFSLSYVLVPLMWNHWQLCGSHVFLFHDQIDVQQARRVIEDHESPENILGAVLETAAQAYGEDDSIQGMIGELVNDPELTSVRSLQITQYRISFFWLWPVNPESPQFILGLYGTIGRTSWREDTVRDEAKEPVLRNPDFLLLQY
jgi:hypothetical protein